MSNGNDISISGSLVRVKCGLSLSTTPPPPPPTTPPPKPTHLCKIAILGNANVGKSSLVQKFINRRYANSISAGETDLLNVNNTNGESSTTTFNSLGTSNTFGGSALTTETTLADYYKKDVTIWYNDKNDIQILPQEDQVKKSTVCIRVQCWDMNIQQHDQQQIIDDLTTTDNDIQSIQSSIITTSPRNANVASLLPLLKRINGLIIVCRCPLPPSSNNVSSNASYVSYASNLSCKDDSDWMELDFLEQEIQQWITFMKDHQEEEGTNNKQHNRPLVYVVLSCADLAVVGYSPREWMQLSIRMQEICHNHGISSWKISTSMDTTSSSDNGVEQQQQSLRQSKILQRMMTQQKQILEDMEDGIEASYIELISLYLQQQQSRKVNIKS